MVQFRNFICVIVHKVGPNYFCPHCTTISKHSPDANIVDFFLYFTKAFSKVKGLQKCEFLVSLDINNERKRRLKMDGAIDSFAHL